METFTENDRPWHVYMLLCADNSIYTGIAVDVAARFALHQSGKGAKYTRSHRPVRILRSDAFADRSSASKEEYRIKQLTASAKRRLCGVH